jgi:hypothetical protein
MKHIAKTLGLASLALLLPKPVEAQVMKTEKTEVQQSSDGTTTETKTVTFSPDVRTRVIKYFDTYRTSEYGLPPAIVTRVKAKRPPKVWLSTRISPGVVISETERPMLVEAPPELVQLMPTSDVKVRYYIAGENVVAVDESYRVVDSIQIPSVKIKVDD